MDPLNERMKALSSAEDFFAFFAVPCDEAVVHVNRLHILKRFYQYIQRDGGLQLLDDVERFRLYRSLLAQAYQDFVASTPAREKVFKVFQDVGGTQHVGLGGLRQSLNERRREASAA